MLPSERAIVRDVFGRNAAHAERGALVLLARVGKWDAAPEDG